MNLIAGLSLNMLYNLFMKNFHFTTTAFILTLISLGYFATDIYLPSLPSLSHYFNATDNQVQMTLFAYMISFAIVPIVFGPLSDYFGRKKIILIGIMIGIIATFGCLFSKSITSMILFRFFQGVGLGGVIIASRTIASDLFSGKELAKQISHISMLMPLVLAIAPTLGGLLQQIFGWQSVFIFLIAYMSIVALWVISRPETLKIFSQKKISQIFLNYRFHLVNFPFIKQILLIYPTIGTYAYLTTSPFLYQELIGLSPAEYGFLSLYVGGAIMLAGFINSKLIHYFSLTKILYLGGTLIILAGLLLFVFYQMGIVTVWSLLIPSLLYFTCVPFCFANCSALAMNYVKDHFGSATALLTTLQFFAGAIGSFIFSTLEDRNFFPLAICFILVGICSIVHQFFISRSVSYKNI